VTTAVLVARDGTRITAETLGEGPVTFVMAHGLTGHRRKTGVRLISGWLARHGRVVFFDQRGHGESSGRCTLGYREPLALDAAIAWARTLSDAPVVTIGFSLGASVAIRHAALARDPASATPVDRDIVVEQQPDATVIVSGVGQWFFRGTKIMDRLFRASATPWGRLALRGQGVRMSVRGWGGPHAPTEANPTSPTACAALITHPLLIVHGTQDQYFPEEHAERVFAAAAGNTRAALWVEQGMGHAERATTQELVERIADWAGAAVRGGA
jgi:pimeloyl-ACP methyl ester carboxylesterase